MRTIRSIAAAVVAGLLALVLAACGGPSGGTTGGTGAGGPKIKEVTFWGGWSGDQAKQLKAQADAFNAAQTDYKVTFVAQEEVEQKLLTGMASGRVPDIVLWDRFNTSVYAGKNAFTALDDRIAADKIDLGRFYGPAVEEMVVDGKHYGLPLLVDNRSLFYNTELFAEAGLEPPTNWDELRQAATTLTKRDGNKLTRAGFSLDDPGLFNMWIRQAGGSMLTEDQTAVAFNSPEGVEVLNFWKQLLDAKVYQLGFGAGGNAFAEGKAAMKYDGPWALSDLDKVKTLKYGIAEPPAGPRGDKAANMGGFGLIIPRGAKNADGAWAFLKWWATEKENAISFGKLSGWIPALIEAAEDPYFTDNEKYAGFVATMKYAQTRPTLKGYADMEGKALIPQLQRFMSGEISAEEALAEAEKRGNQILAEQRK
ncbi:ABC transporter substrate-binding protein [Microlunatus parietis]|uniref:Multiple sugar transport system substrate-binding protein n=1 Tax=Microlunatus parietis TaxID=682979 RepID=A0A7Y9LAM4_9ACTN|nr:ABC transporter substrate-binding protein [Microlunatus parietis]NYE70847.1 multiple sugar transport system substrate-binding protein [Microlunatus parietis]